MREIHIKMHYDATDEGITPAYAGNTEIGFTVHVYDEDHPRVCGKYGTAPQLLAFVEGSPPRMREILIDYVLEVRDERITPAYAGNTLCKLHHSRKLGDHPRVCGKYATHSVVLCLVKGSPPRMREIPLIGLKTCGSKGITPAYAGNTCTAPRMIHCTEDHPRVCGKYVCKN